MFALSHGKNAIFCAWAYRNEKQFVFHATNFFSWYLHLYLSNNDEFVGNTCVFEKINELTKEYFFLLVKTMHFRTITKYVFFDVKICIGPPFATKRKMCLMISTQNEKYGYNISLCEYTTKQQSCFYTYMKLLNSAKSVFSI